VVVKKLKALPIEAVVAQFVEPWGSAVPVVVYSQQGCRRELKT